MLSDYQTLTAALVRDDAGDISVAERDAAIALAVSRYSKDRPVEKVEDLTSAGGQYLDLPVAWETGFSGMRALEYPIGDIPPTLLDIGAWGLYNAPSGPSIMIRESLVAGEQVRSVYTIQHVVSAVADTIPVVDREPVASYAAAILCDQLATLYSGDSDSTIQADSVDHNSKAREFATRAKTLRKRYYDELGIDPKRNVAAGVVVDMDLADSQGNDRLLHGRGYR